MHFQRNILNLTKHCTCPRFQSSQCSITSRSFKTSLIFWSGQRDRKSICNVERIWTETKACENKALLSVWTSGGPQTHTHTHTHPEPSNSCQLILLLTAEPWSAESSPDPLHQMSHTLIRQTRDTYLRPKLWESLPNVQNAWICYRRPLFTTRSRVRHVLLRMCVLYLTTFGLLNKNTHLLPFKHLEEPGSFLI